MTGALDGPIDGHLAGLCDWLAAGALPMAAAGGVALAVERAVGPRLWPGAREALWSAVLLVPWLPSPGPAQVPVGVAAAAAPAAVPWPTLWLCGVAILLLRLVYGHAAVRRRIAASTRPAPTEWLARAAVIAGRLGLRRCPRVRFAVDGSLGAPLAAGLLRPTVVVPPDVDDCALVHELGHVARRDPLRAAVTAVLVACCWWHPIAWIARRRLAVARELGCDARAVAALGGDRRRYRDALAAAARRALAADPERLPRLGFVTFRSALHERLSALHAAPWPGDRRLRAVATVLVPTLLAVGAACLGDRPPTPQPPATRPLPPVLAHEIPASATGPGCLPLRYAVLQAIARDRFRTSSPIASEETLR